MRKYTAILALTLLVLFGFQGISQATDLSSTNVTVTTAPENMERVGRVKMNISTVSFGNGALTYPANGVPLPTKSKFGVDYSVKFMHIMGPPATGYVYKYDSTNHTIRIYQSAGFTPAGSVAAPAFTGSALGTHTHTHTLTNGTAGAAVTFSTDHLEATGGGTLTSSATGGGTPAGSNSAPAFTGNAVAAAPMVELGNVAVAATTLTVMTVGR
jgi:hypothetical protein